MMCPRNALGITVELTISKSPRLSNFMKTQMGIQRQAEKSAAQFIFHNFFIHASFTENRKKCVTGGVGGTLSDVNLLDRLSLFLSPLSTRSLINHSSFRFVIHACRKLCIRGNRQSEGCVAQQSCHSQVPSHSLENRFFTAVYNFHCFFFSSIR